MYGHHRFSEAAKALIVAATATSLIAAPTTALACTQVYMGPELTATGETIYGRSEDAANRYLKEFGVQPRTDGKTYWCDSIEFIDHASLQNEIIRLRAKLRDFGCEL